MHSDYQHVPTLDDVAMTRSQNVFRVYMLLSQARIEQAQAMQCKSKRWRFLERAHTFKLTVYTKHALYLSTL